MDAIRPKECYNAPLANKLIEEFEKRGIKFTYPTQTLYLNTENK